MILQEQITDYFHQERLVERTDEEIAGIMRANDEIRAGRAISALTKGYYGTEGEEEFMDAVSEQFDGMVVYDMLKAREPQFLQWEYERIARGDLRDAEVLDIGCASGLEACFLATLARRVTGIDPSAKMIRVAKERKARRNQANVEFLLGDRSKLDFPDGSFDRVICINSLVTPGEMRMEDADLYYGFAMRNRIEQMHRVLRSRGQVVLIEGIEDGELDHGKNLTESILKYAKFNILDSSEFYSKWGINEVCYFCEKT